MSIPGRLLFGWMADRISPAVVLAIVGILLACGPSLLEVLFVRMGLDNVNLLWLYTVPYGLGIAGNAVVLPILVSRCFGVLHFSKIMGLVMSGFAIGIVVGIPGAGKIFDATGSYEIAFLACIVIFLASSILVMTIKPPATTPTSSRSEGAPHPPSSPHLSVIPVRIRGESSGTGTHLTEIGACPVLAVPELGGSSVAVPELELRDCFASLAISVA